MSQVIWKSQEWKQDPGVKWRFAAAMPIYLVMLPAMGLLVILNSQLKVPHPDLLKISGGKMPASVRFESWLHNNALLLRAWVRRTAAARCRARLGRIEAGSAKIDLAL